MKKLFRGIAIVAACSLIVRRMREARMLNVGGQFPPTGCRSGNVSRFQPRHSTLV
ncbi:MAG: hypothetical protein ACR2OU_06860 [Thermomicrobiales bacterium]